MQPTREETFARTVREAREARRWSQAQANIHTGVDRFTISRMEQGLIPRLDIVEKWARGLGEDVNHWRQLAGYPNVWNGGGYFLVGLRRLAAQLTAECGEERAASLVGSIRFAQFPGPDTPIEHVEQALRDLETDIREELGAR